VTVVTPYLHFGVNMGWTHLNDYVRMLPQLGVEILPSTRLERIGGGDAHLRHLFSDAERLEPFDVVVAGVSPTPRDTLAAVAREIAPTTVVGDAVAPRSALEAFREGDRAGRTV
jgi:hypothetical protein